MSNTIQRYFAEVDHKQLSREEEVELAKRIDRGDEKARKKLARCNLRLVISIAKKYRNYGVPFPDLIQEGNLGLMKAIDRFDWRKGYKFSTYATWWIKQAILKSLKQKGRTVRVPDHKQELISKISKLEQEMKSNGEVPTVEKIAEELDTSEDKIEKAQIASQRTVSLDKPLAKNKEGESLKEILKTEKGNSFDPEQEAKEKTIKEKLKKILNEELTDREKHILKLRTGLEDYRTRTLEEVGEIFYISRERVRQLQNRAIEKLQDPKIKKELKTYLP